MHFFQTIIVLIFMEREYRSVINWPQMPQDLVPNLEGLPFLKLPDVQK